MNEIFTSARCRSSSNLIRCSAAVSGWMAVDGDNDNDDVDGDSDSGDSDVILPVVVRNPVPFLWRQTDKNSLMTWNIILLFVTGE